MGRAGTRGRAHPAPHPPRPCAAIPARRPPRMTRRPAAFRLDDPHVIVADDDTRAAKGTIRILPQPENFDLPVPVPPPLPAKRRFSWGAVFWSALGGLMLLGGGLATVALVEDLYARATWLGTLGATLAALASLSLLVIC